MFARIPYSNSAAGLLAAFTLLIFSPALAAHEQIAPAFSSEFLPAYVAFTLLGYAEIARNHRRRAASDLRSTLIYFARKDY